MLIAGITTQGQGLQHSLNTRPLTWSSQQPTDLANHTSSISSFAFNCNLSVDQEKARSTG